MEYQDHDGGIMSNAEREFHEKQKQDAERKMLRDQFAMAALTGLLVAGLDRSLINKVSRAYEYADAMLKARENAQQTWRREC